MPLLLTIIGIFIRNDAGISGDVSTQRYTITDTITRDTTSPNAELRTFWTFYLNSDKPTQNLQADNAIYLSNAAVHNRLHLDFTTDINPIIRFQTSADGELRYYHHRIPLLGDTIRRNSYFNNSLRLKITPRFSESFSLNAQENLELHRYLSSDSFNYNYFINRAGLTASIGFGDLSFLILNYNYNRLWAQNQSEHNYAENSLTFDWDNYFGFDWHLTFSNYFTRRSYTNRLRCYWEEEPHLSCNWDFSPGIGLRAEENLRLTWFDETTTVYQNQVENRFGLELETQLGSWGTFYLGPHFELTHSLAHRTDQDYREIALYFGIDLFKSSRFWLSVDDRVGERRYLFADSGFQSDYMFNEFNLLGNWNIITTTQGGLSLQIMVSIAPEWHREAIDDLAATLCAIELKYSW